VRAKNGVDYSNIYSAVVTCLTPTNPSGMYTPTNGAVNPSSIVINWSELTDSSLNGRDLPTYYKLEWWNAAIPIPDWQEITSESAGKILTYTHTPSSNSVFPSGSIQ
jgi:hypothetical protein